MEILGTTLRICVDDLETAVPFYERLSGGPAMRFERGGVQVAAVGCFLLMSGPESELEVLRKVTATIAVEDVDEATPDPHRLRRPRPGGPDPDPGRAATSSRSIPTARSTSTRTAGRPGERQGPNAATTMSVSSAPAVPSGSRSGS